MPPITRSKTAPAVVAPGARHMARDTFARSKDLVEYIVKMLPLTTLLQYRRVSLATDDAGQHILHRRVLRYTLPFFRNVEDHKLFFHYLEDFASWIIGSVPLATLSYCGDPACPDNLNVITIDAKLEDWFNTLTNVLRYNLVEDRACTGVYAPVASRFMKFQYPKVPGKSITVTSAYGSHFFELYFAVPNTIQSCFISSNEAGTPYVQMTSDHEGTYSWFHTAWHHTLTQKPVDLNVPYESPFPGIVELHASTKTLGRPCGYACPGKWRYAKGLKGFGHWKWGGVDQIEGEPDDANLVRLGNSRIRWRTGEECENPLCKKD
ncbi:hypothetical protein C8R44DRAFT_874496 [Mycena epipterygia]|nr:hypothetical protein C8R44DRAFT_874496 [Mycena epipterygia]